MNITSSPFVSVVIPTYNHAHLLGRALQSVLDQSYTNWEVIVIDNHSQDNTDEVAQSYTESRISLLKIHNEGVIAASRNMGIRAAKGEWIAFLDSDDWWLSNKLQVCFEHINDNVDLIYHDLTIIRDKSVLFGKNRKRGRKLVNPVLNDLLVKVSCINNSSVIVRKSLLERINGINEDPQMVASEDFNTWLRIAQLTDKFVYIPKRLGFYMLHVQGVSQKDMTASTRCASSAFLNILNESQRKRHESVLAYSGGRFAYNNNLLKNTIPKLTYSLRYGNTMIKLKSLYMIVSILFKKTAMKCKCKTWAIRQ